MPDFPSLREELDRKSSEAMEWLIGSCEKGLISEAQFSTGVDVLWLALAGLVKKEFVELVTQATELALDADKRVSKTLVNATGSTLLVVRWTPGQANVEIITADKSKTVTADPHQVLATVKGLLDRFTAAGYKEV
jgi:hypothetical protein